MTSLKRK